MRSPRGLAAFTAAAGAAIGLCLVALFPAFAAEATLTVRVENVSPEGGLLRVALYDQASYADANETSDSVKYADVEAAAPETVVTMSGIAPGIYAIKTYQDVNRSGKFAMSWLGLPLERYGFSNDARPFLSEPGFDRTKFKLSPGANTIIIHLQ